MCGSQPVTLTSSLTIANVTSPARHVKAARHHRLAGRSDGSSKQRVSSASQELISAKAPWRCANPALVTPGWTLAHDPTPNVAVSHEGTAAFPAVLATDPSLQAETARAIETALAAGLDERQWRYR